MNMEIYVGGRSLETRQRFFIVAHSSQAEHIEDLKLTEIESDVFQRILGKVLRSCSLRDFTIIFSYSSLEGSTQVYTLLGT